jgi:UDP-N-acetylglucosamine 1-carboxyvinyltransferase
MTQYLIEGGSKLSGEIEVKGAKNLVLKVLAGCLLLDEEITIDNVPEIGDVLKMIEILKSLGAKVEKISHGQYTVCAKNLAQTQLDTKLAQGLRASIVLSGPLLARLKEVKITKPGGCPIGQRPIDMFLAGFEALGAETTEEENSFIVKAKKLRGANFIFTRVSVTGTETLIMLATLTPGKTVLKNCALEPEISGLVNWLNNCGAKISGTGTPTIIIEGVEKLKGRNLTIMPDRIEAGTFVVMGLLTESSIKISNCEPHCLEIFLAMVKKTGGSFEIGSNYILTKPVKKLKATDLITHEYPGYPTDLQAPFTLLMTQAEGTSLIHDPIFEGRLFFTDKLNQMGANIIMCDPHRVIINGPTPLFGKKVDSPDLRAGITLVLAGLIAEGQTTIGNVYQIERGYENLVGRLQQIGAKIKGT